MCDDNNNLPVGRSAGPDFLGDPLVGLFQDEFPGEQDAAKYRTPICVIGRFEQHDEVEGCSYPDYEMQLFMECLQGWNEVYAGADQVQTAQHFEAAMHLGNAILQEAQGKNWGSALFWTGMRMMGFEKTDEGEFVFVVRACDLIRRGFLPQEVSDYVFFRFDPESFVYPRAPYDDGSIVQTSEEYVAACLERLGIKQVAQS
jgi:hypothetical protein